MGDGDQRQALGRCPNPPSYLRFPAAQQLPGSTARAPEVLSPPGALFQGVTCSCSDPGSRSLVSRTQQRSQAAVQPGPPGPPTRPRGPAYFRSAPHFCLAAAFKGILFDGWYPGAAAKLTPLNHLPHFQATAREVFRGGEADPKSKAKFRSSGEGNGNPLQYSCLENSTDGAAGGLQSMGLQRVRHH